MCSNIKINQLKFVIDMKTMKLWRNILVMCAAMLSLASCSSDDDYKFDASKLEGKWRKAIRSGIMDGETVIYTFYSEN